MFSASAMRDVEDAVGIFRLIIEDIAIAPSALENRRCRTAFQTMLPHSAQNTSGTSRLNVPAAKSSSKRYASILKGSFFAGSIHLAATLASMTIEVTARGPRESFLPQMEMALGSEVPATTTPSCAGQIPADYAALPLSAHSVREVRSLPPPSTCDSCGLVP